jgi:hypothetical protein
MTVGRTMRFSGVVVTARQRGPGSGDDREDDVVVTVGRRGPGGGDGWNDSAFLRRGDDGRAA